MTEDARTLLRRFALALCIWREARGESLLGKLLVGQTIENRVTDPRWPDTYVGVITQRAQFSSFNKDDPNAVLFPAEDDTTWADCVAAADMVLSATEPLTRANHYHAKTVRPKWARADKLVAGEGRHLFYAL